MYYNFILNMWKMNRLDKADLELLVNKGKFTEEEKREILNTPGS